MAKVWREQVHDLTREEIKRIAREQMAEKGSASISMRAIAREMQTTTPALYYYYSNRDDLITALVVDAFQSLSDALKMADQGQPSTQYTQRASAILQAYRQWALANSIEFKLIYGTPIPGYHAPEEVTAPVAKQGIATFISLCEETLAAGQLSCQSMSLPEALTAQFATLKNDRGFDLPLSLIYQIFSSWTKLHGHVCLELYGQLGQIIGDSEEMYQHEVSTILRELGFTSS